MMDRNTTIGLILIGLLLTVFTIVNQPSKEDIEKAKKEQAAKKKQENKKSENQGNHAAKQENTGNDTPTPRVTAPIKKATSVTLENKELQVVLNSKGANVEAVYLKNFRSYDNFAKQKKDALCLFKSEDASNFIVIPGVMSTENIVFDVIKKKNSFDFIYTSAKKKITVSYGIKDDYRLSYNLAFEGFSALEMDKIRLKWKMNFKRTERKIKGTTPNYHHMF